MSETVYGILLCAGSGSRMGFDKLLTPLCGTTAIERSMDALIAGGVNALIFAVSAEHRAFCEALHPGVPAQLVAGGETRTASVQNALLAAADTPGAIAVIHDAARCMVSPALVRASIDSARTYGSGVAAVHATDTVLRQTAGAVTAVPRDEVYLMQTPQTFRLSEIRHAYESAGGAATDDCTLYARAGYSPRFVPGSPDNFKLTLPADWARAEARLRRFGTGFDTHRLMEGRRLILGGVDIPYDKGLLGHSDADVLLHAVTDALLGAAALGDIGKLFPDSDAAYLNIDSRILLRRAVERIRERGLRPASIDATILAQKPKMAPHIDEMRANIAADCGLDVRSVSVKATTTEGMNDEGRGLCISAQAIASLV